MAASKFADFYGALPGHKSEIADVTSAYLQAFLKGKKTWVELPRHRWPKEWHKKFGDRRVVCPLECALYGHPEAGGFWEMHCHEQVIAAGFRKVAEEWPGCYYHDEWKCFLVVYVDDLKMSGPVENLPKAWAALRARMDMDPPLEC